MPLEKVRQPITPKNKRLVLLLDSSGSMSSQKNDIIGGVNETIKIQREAEPAENLSTFFNIITFSDYASAPQEHTLASVPFLTDKSYIPGGSTALYDAMGSTIDKYKNEYGVIFIVATDGEENASRTYTYKQIVDSVKNLREKQNWNFIYLSEDIDTFKQGDAIGISSQAYNCNNLMTEKSKLGTGLKSFACQEAITNMRKGSNNVKISQSSLSPSLSTSSSSPSTFSPSPSTSSTSFAQIPQIPRIPQFPQIQPRQSQTQSHTSHTPSHTQFSSSFFF